MVVEMLGGEEQPACLLCFGRIGEKCRHVLPSRFVGYPSQDLSAGGGEHLDGSVHSGPEVQVYERREDGAIVLLGIFCCPGVQAGEDQRGALSDYAEVCCDIEDPLVPILLQYPDGISLGRQSTFKTPLCPCPCIFPLGRVDKVYKVDCLQFLPAVAGDLFYGMIGIDQVSIAVDQDPDTRSICNGSE